MQIRSFWKSARKFMRKQQDDTNRNYYSYFHHDIIRKLATTCFGYN